MLSRQQSLNTYGTEAYTAWDPNVAVQDALKKGINVMQKRPNPAQLLSSGQNQTIQANKQPFKPIKGFTAIQNQYAEQMATPPDYASLYDQYSKDTGLKQVQDLVLNIDNTVADIEDKIAKIEPDINKEVGNYLINEGQRGRMVSASELPLRTQYADILRSRGRLSAEATAKASLVNTLMGYAKDTYSGRSDYLKALVDIEKGNKTSGGGGNWWDIPKKEDKSGEIPVVEPLTEKDLGTFIKQPLSEKGKSGNVIYTTPSGTQVKWSPLLEGETTGDTNIDKNGGQWVRYEKNSNKLKSIGL